MPDHMAKACPTLELIASDANSRESVVIFGGKKNKKNKSFLKQMKKAKKKAKKQAKKAAAACEDAVEDAVEDVVDAAEDVAKDVVAAAERTMEELQDMAKRAFKKILEAAANAMVAAAQDVGTWATNVVADEATLDRVPKDIEPENLAMMNVY
eukprot:gene5104-3004_t